MQVDDVLAGERLDSLVIANEAVPESVRVYNFTVARTANYFAGMVPVWVHNASPCALELDSKPWAALKPKEKGFRGEVSVYDELTEGGYKTVGNSFDPGSKNLNDAFADWDGQTGIDGIYRDANGRYFIVESKATGGTKKADPDGCVDKLCIMVTGERQMSKKWIIARLEKAVPDAVERQKIIDGLENQDGSVTRLYAQTDANGTSYNVINELEPDKVTIGKKWKP